MINLRAFYNNTYYNFVEITSYKDGSCSIDLSEYGYDGLFTPEGKIRVEQMNENGEWILFAEIEQC